MIETERLLLRKPRPGDAPGLLEAISDPEVMRYIQNGRTGDLAAAERSIERWLARWEESGVGQFVLERRDDGRFIGRSGFLVWDPDVWEPAPTGETEIGWAIVRSAWGNGYATEAALALRDWAIADRGLTRLISLIRPGNERSVRVAEKIGETYEREVMMMGEPAMLYSIVL
ncbi:MAG: GNAT family N-acetyltransferase [Gaiellaceae bacterium]